MTTVKVCCDKCQGRGFVEEYAHPVGGYGPMHSEPSIRESECDACGGSGRQEITRAEHLSRNLLRE